MSESLAGEVSWKDVDKTTFINFTQFAYTGDYSVLTMIVKASDQPLPQDEMALAEPISQVEVVESTTEDPFGGWGSLSAPRKDKKKGSFKPTLRTPKPMLETFKYLSYPLLQPRFYLAHTCNPTISEGINENISEVLLLHTSLYILADKWGVESLKMLTLLGLHQPLIMLRLDALKVQYIVDLAQYIYKDERTPDLYNGIDKLRELVCQYVVANSDVMTEDAMFMALVEEGALLDSWLPDDRSHSSHSYTGSTTFSVVLEQKPLFQLLVPSTTANATTMENFPPASALDPAEQLDVKSPPRSGPQEEEDEDVFHTPPAAPASISAGPAPTTATAYTLPLLPGQYNTKALTALRALPVLRSVACGWDVRRHHRAGGLFALPERLRDLCGVCTNCHFNSEGKRCSFHNANSAVAAPAPVPTSVPAPPPTTTTTIAAVAVAAAATSAASNPASSRLRRLNIRPCHACNTARRNIFSPSPPYTSTGPAGLALRPKLPATTCTIRELASHLADNHGNTFTQPQIQAIVQQSQVRSLRPRNECPLCCISIEAQQDSPSKEKSKGKTEAGYTELDQQVRSDSHQAPMEQQQQQEPKTQVNPPPTKHSQSNQSLATLPDISRLSWLSLCE
ncbi:MAG: hypothetical protein M1829_001671 [Trizodia sp. TS-e1964]|nr:MAG: hypothetical protein M1829_001671 [Trizodia sp. TS-e1964]